MNKEFNDMTHKEQLDFARSFYLYPQDAPGQETIVLDVIWKTNGEPKCDFFKIRASQIPVLVSGCNGLKFTRMQLVIKDNEGD